LQTQSRQIEKNSADWILPYIAVSVFK
jgi:hypothetical protein